MTLEQLVGEFLKLGGVASLIAALINVLKTFGIVKDGDAPKVSLLLNLVGLGGLLAANLLNLNVAGLDATAALIATALLALVALLGQLGLTKVAHKILKWTGAPVVGKSLT